MCWLLLVMFLSMHGSNMKFQIVVSGSALIAKQ